MYLFERIADAWTETTTFAPPVELDGFDGFGRSVALSGDRAAVAWPGSEVDGVLLAGSTFVYREGAGGWELDARVLPSVVGIGYGFGWEMAFAGETLIAAYSEPNDLRVFAVSHAVELACACDGSAPCGNEFGAAGCRVLAHEGAKLEACGSASLAADDLVLEVSRIPANQSGLVFLAQSRREGRDCGSSCRADPTGGVRSDPERAPDSSLDRESLAEKAAAVERHLERVAARLPTRPEDLRPMTDAADAVILHLWQATQIVIDLALAACVQQRLGAPSSHADAFRRLERAGRLDAALAGLV